VSESAPLDPPAPPPAYGRGVRTLLGLPLRDHVLLAEALWSLAVASATIRLAAFKRVAARAAQPPKRLSSFDVDTRNSTARRVRWAIRAWAGRVPWRAVCFQQGVAAQAMLRRRGIASTLYYGVANQANRGLMAHVWIMDGEISVIGCENSDEYRVLGTFPGNENLIS